MSGDDRRSHPVSVPSRLLHWLTGEPLLAILLVLCVTLMLADPRPWRAYRGWLNLPTIAALLGLLAAAQGVRASGLIQRYARRVLRHVSTQRSLALLLIALSALLSMILTNDVSLFLIVPVTLAVAEWVDVPISRLVIFEALAVNVGSSLSPVGNPQNLLLWHDSGLSMIAFVRFMALPAAIMGIVLTLATWIAFPGRRLARHDRQVTPISADHTLAWLAPLLLVIFILLLEMGYVFPATGLILLVLGIVRPSVLFDMDWGLVATIALMLLTLGHLADLPSIAGHAAALNWSSQGTVYLAGVILSQLISNVPATVALLHFAPDPMLLAVAVNVGSSGIVVGSLANFIALRLHGGRRIWYEFHLVSVPYLLTTVLLIGWLVIQR